MGNSAGVTKFCMEKDDNIEDTPIPNGTYKESRTNVNTVKNGVGTKQQQSSLNSANSSVVSKKISATMAENNERASYSVVPTKLFPPVQKTKSLPSTITGVAALKNSRINKGLAFTIEERQYLGIHGLLAPSVKTQEMQVEHCLLEIEGYKDDLNKYIFLMGLLDRNQHLFYRVVCENVDMCLPIIYTPTVGLACQKYGLIYQQQRGLYISIHDKGHIFDVLTHWPELDIRAIVVTDGERILGLGDLGAHGMGIPVGKLALYTALGGIRPYYCLPITLDVGTNNEEVLKDKFYVGIRQRRVTGKAYDDFVDEFMRAVVKRYGYNTLIQFEDFGNKNAYRLLEKYRNKYCTFNDDIQGTAGVAVAGIFAALRITKKKFSDNVILFQGAGEAALGIADLAVMAMEEEGLSKDAARERIYLVDSKGLVVQNRASGGVEGQKVHYAKSIPHIAKLEDAVKEIKPNILIGASAIGGAFTKEILETMGKNHEKPIIFALSNPTSKAECTAEAAYTSTDGRCIFASGSPFPPTVYKNKTYKSGQGNNSYIFPGVALGIICVGVRHIGDEIFLKAAKILAAKVSENELKDGSLYPPLSDVRKVSVDIAVEIATDAYANRTASVYPQPDNIRSFIEEQVYDYRYKSVIPETYSFPKEAEF